ncbi:MAG: class I SAM-dependent methyltransferase [Anaerolineales bacterium]
MTPFDYQRYLASKRTVEQRALNQYVWDSVIDHLRRIVKFPVRVLELGAGIGSMALRLTDEAGDLGVHYSLVESSQASLERAREGFETKNSTWKFEFFREDIYEFLRARPAERWDVLVAHAVLDLLDLAAAIPQFLTRIKPNGYFYFPINYDGLTIFEPKVDDSFEEELLAAYHRSMDQRSVDGKPSGDSHSGRRLLSTLQSNGAGILAAGASDWVVFPTDGKYPADEEFFMECILQTMEDELRKVTDLDQTRLGKWLKTRRDQLAKGELIYVAHQLDVFGAVRR